MIINIILLSMVFFAIVAIQTQVLRRSVIYLGVFSLLSSFSYLLLKAPDVAIAEAVIGCTLSTIIFLVALKKYKIFRIYYCEYTLNTIDKNKLFTVLSNFAKVLELQLDLIHTSDDIDAIINNHDYDIVIEHTDYGFVIHGDECSYHFDYLVYYLTEHSDLEIAYDYIVATDGDKKWLDEN